jgi:hypothetical protein
LNIQGDIVFVDVFTAVLENGHEVGQFEVLIENNDQQFPNNFLAHFIDYSV